MHHCGCSCSPQLSSKLLRIRTSYRHDLLPHRAAFPLHTAPLVRNNIHRCVSTSPCPAPNTASFNSSQRLSGATCMITGGASGIGFAIAQRFLREGAGKIILVGRRKERLTNALERLRGQHVGTPQKHCGEPVEDEAGAESAAAQEVDENTSSDIDGGGTHDGKLSSSKTHSPSGLGGSENPNASECDRLALKVGDVGDPSFWSDEIKNTMDTVDILINAAGVSHSALLPLAKDEHIAQILRTNLQGTIFACRAMTRRALRSQRKQQLPREASRSGGSNSTKKTKCIINISSLHATKGGVGASTYASTKAGVIALTRAIAAEGSISSSAASVRANVIVPGYIDTEMLDEFSDGFRGEARQSIPLKRFGTQEEVADAAAFLASNRYANNCVLNLDGGLSAI